MSPKIMKSIQKDNKAFIYVGISKNQGHLRKQ